MTDTPEDLRQRVEYCLFDGGLTPNEREELIRDMWATVQTLSLGFEQVPAEELRELLLDPNTRLERRLDILDQLVPLYRQRKP